MSDLSEPEVIEYAATLLMETERLRQDAIDSARTYNMYKLPVLPRELVRQSPVYILSPDLIHEEKEIRSLILTFQTEVKNLPLERGAAGTITEAIQKTADKIEKAAAIFLARLDPDKANKEARIWNQLVQPLSVEILEMTPIMSSNPAENFCWTSTSVDLDGCGWLDKGGTPSVFGREYQQFAFSVENMSQRRDGPEGPDAKLRWGGPDGKSGKWDWIASDDFSKRNVPPIGSTKKLELCDMVWLDDFNGSGMIYLVALNRKQNGISGAVSRMFGGAGGPGGKLVWKGPNPFGRCSAFLTPGNKTPQRLPHDRFLPYLQELKTVSDQMNLVDSTRATGARNRAAPRQYVKGDPESLKEYMARNEGKLPPATNWPNDGGMLTLLGEIMEPPAAVDPDLEKVAQRLDVRLQRYMHGALSTLRDPEVLKESTATGLVSSWDSSMISLSPVLGASDRTDRQMIEAWEHSIKFIAEHYGASYAKFELLATGDERVKGKALQAGDSATISADDFDAAHEWRVNTRSRTMAQKQALLSLALETMAPLADGRPGIGIYDDLFEAADITDRDERIETLAREAILASLDDEYVMQAAKLSFEHEVEVDSGERIPFSQQDPATVQGAAGANTAVQGPVDGAIANDGPPAPAPQRAGSRPPAAGGQQERSPLTEQAQGGSGPNVSGG